jgi:hypothetical protein
LLTLLPAPAPHPPPLLVPPLPLLILRCRHRMLRAHLPCYCQPAAPRLPHPSILRPHGHRSMPALGLRLLALPLKSPGTHDGSIRPSTRSASSAGLQPLTSIGAGSRSRASGRHRGLLRVVVTHPTASKRRVVWCFSGGGGVVVVPPGGRASSTYLSRGPAPLSPLSSFKPPRSLVAGSRHVLIGSTPLVVVAVGRVLRPPRRRGAAPHCLRVCGHLRALPHSPADPPHSEPSTEDNLPTPNIRLDIAIIVVSRLNAAEDFRSLSDEDILLHEVIFDQILFL